MATGQGDKLSRGASAGRTSAAFCVRLWGWECLRHYTDALGAAGFCKETACPPHTSTQMLTPAALLVFLFHSTLAGWRVCLRWCWTG